MLNTDGHRVYVQTHCGECRGRIVSYMETVDQYHRSCTEPSEVKAGVQL